MATELAEKKPMPEDMTLEEHELLNTFIDNGCVGIQKVSESDIFQWFKLYMSGQTYSEIAIATKKKKEFILFMSYKQSWMQKKMSHFDSLVLNMEEKLKQTKLESANTVSTIVTALGKYYEEQFVKFLKTGDKDIIDGVDTKMLSQYYKSIDALDKLMGSASESAEKKSSPLVNLNFNSSDLSMKQVDSNTLELTNSSYAGELLKKLAEAKKSSKES